MRNSFVKIPRPRNAEDTVGIPIPEQRRKRTGQMLELIEHQGHNLDAIDVVFPLGTSICVTGVSW